MNALPAISLSRSRGGLMWLVALGGIAAALVFAAAIALGLFRSGPAGNVPTPPSQWAFTLSGVPAPPFSLVDQFGHSRALASYSGREVVLAFVDARCTSVCPLTAEILKNAHDRLPASSRARVALVAINANPLSTSPRATWTWSKEHNMLHAWSFLTGTPNQLRRVYSAYRIYDRVVGGNQVQHDAAVIIVDARGRERLYYDTAGMRDRPTVVGEEQAYATGMRDWLP